LYFANPVVNDKCDSTYQTSPGNISGEKGCIKHSFQNSGINQNHFKLRIQLNLIQFFLSQSTYFFAIFMVSQNFGDNLGNEKNINND
jgi:hypothetical protein